ncbi:MAG: RDD family protein [Acidimicrobiia bacterium]
MTDDSYYELLGVEPGASRDELRAAYRERVESLEAAREGKGVTDSTLRANREETARVRTAWNVLSDPFQRQRYDAQLDASADGDGDVDVDASGESGGEVELTGWRKLMAPPPPKQPRNGTAASGGGKTPPPRRPVPQPTIPLPPGVTLAEPRTRGMAMLFDISILLLIYIGIQFFVPSLIQSDYKDITDKISNLADREDNQNEKADNFSDRADTAKKNGNTEKAQSLRDDEKAARNEADAASKQADKLADDIKGTQYTTLVIIFVLFMLYLVPMTAMTGRTLGMRGRKIKVLRVDGAPAGWFPSFARYVIPIAIALAVPTLGPVLGLGLVLWSFRDPNRQGIHDKLAKTIVVDE